MAKSLRSKVKRRWRALRRKVIEEAVVKPLCEEMHNRIKATVNGYEYRQPKKPNAFKNPDDPNAEFPQFVPPKIIDMRSAYVPIGGDEWVGARRKQVTDVEIIEDKLNGTTNLQEQQEIEEIQQQMEEKEWEFEDEKQIQEEGPSKRSLLKKIGKNKKNATKNGRATQSRKILTNF